MYFNSKKFNEINDFIEKSNISAKIVAISKNHPKESVLEAINSGVKIFGENRVFEAKDKFEELIKKFPEIELHLTGPLQSNKVNEAIELFDVFHTIDREKIAKKISNFSDKITKKKMFIQVNIGEEQTKSGVKPSLTKSFVGYCVNDLKLNVVGLMCIPPIDVNSSKYFQSLKDLADESNLSELSIGMSDDYEIALKYNPAYIRLGSILFGSRKWQIK